MILKIKVDNKPEIELPELEGVEREKTVKGKIKRTKQFVVKGTKVLCSEGTSWKKAKERFNELSIENKLTLEKFKELCATAVREDLKEKNWGHNSEKLKKLLGIYTVPFCRFCLCIAGKHVLDLVELDKMLGVPETVSTKEVVFNLGGQEAVDLVEAMI